MESRHLATGDFDGNLNIWYVLHFAADLTDGIWLKLAHLGVAKGFGETRSANLLSQGSQGDHKRH